MAFFWIFSIAQRQSTRVEVGRQRIHLCAPHALLIAGPQIWSTIILREADSLSNHPKQLELGIGY